MTGLKQPLKRMATWAIVLGGTALAGSGLAAYGQNAVGSPINGFDPRTYDLAHSGDRSGGNQVPLTDSAILALKRLDAEAAARNKTSPKPAAVNPYVAKAEAVFATDANGNYTNPRVRQIVSDTIKLYNQAGSQYEHTPGYYQPLQQYFIKLKPGEEQNVMLVVLDDLLPPTVADHRKFPVGNDLLGAIIPDYAKYLGFINKHGYLTLADYSKEDVLKRPVSNDPQGEATRIAFASVLRVPYPMPTKQNNPTIALSRQPGGQ